MLLFLLSSSPTFAVVHRYEQCPEASDTNLPVYVWQETEVRPKGVVLLLHGIAERAYSLDHLAGQLVTDGFLVYGLDERGHGWWHFHQKKGAPGYNCDFNGTVDDVDKLLHVLKTKHPGLPIFLIGESVGAAVAWRAAIDTPDVVDGIVAASTGCKPAHAKLIWLISDLVRNCWRWNHQINIVRYQRRYGTDDLPTFEQNLKDPERRKTLTLGELLAADSFLRRNDRFAQRLDPQISVLIIQGTKDHVLNPKSARKVYCAANTRDKRYVEVPECGHVLLGTNNPKPLVTESITSFLNEQALRHKAATAYQQSLEFLSDLPFFEQ